ncbi:hypothetical protein RUM44_010018 [Polyplax serrata]|uniref:Cytochrome P450 303a1 n=1 Tax=Polyplax serrata TaxID=468196 RepID=A0ABR1AUC4_POLSC
MWMAAIFFVAILCLLMYLDTKKPHRYPPGPPWLPILGSAMTVQKLRKKTGYLYKACTLLANQHGPVVGLKVGKDRQVVCCGYDAIKEMLTKDDFDGRPQGPFYETRTWGIRRGLLLTDEEFWHEQRKFVLRHLREFGFGRRTMSGLVEDEASELVKYFKARVAEGNNILPMRDAFGVYVLNTLWSMLAGIRYSPEDLELKKLQNLLTELFANIDMVGCAFSQFPILRYVAPEASGYNQFVQIHRKVWTFLKNELDNHKRSFKPGEPRDLMDVYLQMLASEQKKDSFSESQLLAICMDMFMAGSETTSKSLGFGFMYLLRHPEVQKKAQEEIDAVIGRDRLPTLDDKPKMPYMEALTLESVRVFMGRTFSIPHRALRDTTLQGYDIPKDTMLIANFNNVLMDEKYWKDPEVFRPERFLDETGSVHIPDQYLPFGFGTRVPSPPPCNWESVSSFLTFVFLFLGKHRCMGEILAKANIFLFTTSLLQNFTFTVPEGEPVPSTEGIDGVTASPNPYNALVTLRT